MDTLKYLVIPFIPHGRTFQGCDCWGLVRLIYKEELNIDLPSFTTEYDKLNPVEIEDVIGLNKETIKYVEVKDEDFKEFDLLLFEQYGKDSHIGLYVDNDYYIHTNRRKDTVIEKLSVSSHKLKGVYRVR